MKKYLYQRSKFLAIQVRTEITYEILELRLVVSKCFVIAFNFACLSMSFQTTHMCVELMDTSAPFHLTDNYIMNESLDHGVGRRSIHTYHPEIKSKCNLTTKYSAVCSNDKTWKLSSSSCAIKKLAEELHLLFQKSEEERKLAMEGIERGHKHDMEMLARGERRNAIDKLLSIVSLAAALASLVYTLLTAKPGPEQTHAEL
jgi:hypothetical protein